MMRRALLLLAAAALVLGGAEKKKKPPDLEVISSLARRAVDNIVIDGQLRNSGEKPIRGLVLLFDFLDSGKQVLTTQKTTLEEEVLEPGQEAAFHVGLSAPPRAVRYQLNATEANGRDLRVANAGPFTIE